MQNGMASIFPNPVSDVASLSVDRAILNSKALLVDMHGKVLQTLLINKTLFKHQYAWLRKSLLSIKI